MGRIVTYLTILLVMDLLFIITGQTCNGTNGCSLSSGVLEFIQHPSGGFNSIWFKTIIGDVNSILAGTTSSGGLGNLFANALTTGIAIGALIFGLKNEAYLWMPIGVALGFFAGDFLVIYSVLYSYNSIVATLLMSPIAFIYIFTCLEWVRGMP